VQIIVRAKKYLTCEIVSLFLIDIALMRRQKSLTDTVLTNGTSLRDGLLNDSRDKFKDNDDVFVWKEDEDSETASRKLFEGDASGSVAGDGDKDDEKVDEEERRLDGHWKYWGEEDHLMGKAGKTRKGRTGKSKSSKKCLNKWNRRPPSARGGANRKVGGRVGA
jgi:hypothetical protein